MGTEEPIGLFAKYPPNQNPKWDAGFSGQNCLPDTKQK